MNKGESPLKNIEDNLRKIDEKLEYLNKENELFLRLSTELRKITSATTNELYSVSNNLLNNKRLANNSMINQLMEEKTLKEQSIIKLAALFEKLTATNDVEDEKDELPLMEIREELDDDGNVISSSVTPQSFGKPQTTENKPVAKVADVPKKESEKEISNDAPFDNKNEEGLPFMDIKEEIDELGNAIRGQALPQVGGDDIESKEPVDQIDNNQIMELFEDMGIIANKNEPLSSSSSNNEPKGLSDFEKNLKSKLASKKKIEEEPVLEEPSESQDTQPTPTIPREAMLELELIADDLMEDEPNEYDGEEEYEYQDWEIEEQEEDEDDDDYDFEPRDNLVNNLLMQQINSLRNKTGTKSEPGQKPALKSALKSKTKKTVKTVKFNTENLEQVKEIENVSEELKKIDNTHLKKSLFKQTRLLHNDKDNTETSYDHKSLMTEVISETIKERLIVETPDEMPTLRVNRPKLNFSSQLLELSDLLTPVDVAPERKQSRFKQNFLNKQQPAASAKPALAPLKKNLQSLNPRPKAKKSSAVKLGPISENIVEHDIKEQEPIIDEIRREEIVEADKSDMEVVETSLDYSALQDDVDGMAKAYVLGLYNDDIALEGEVIDNLSDFEKINKILELKQSEKLDTKSETTDQFPLVVAVEEQEDNAPIMADKIVERELNDSEVDLINTTLFDQDDYSLNQDVLTQQINAGYHALRTKLILNRNHFKKSNEEQEFEPIDEHGNILKMSRFKAAKLVNKEDL